jgi:hypothetical protein
VFVYYFALAHRHALGPQEQTPRIRRGVARPTSCLRRRLFLLWQMASGGRVLSAISGFRLRAPNKSRGQKTASQRRPFGGLQVFARAKRNAGRHAFPRILDEYVVREFLFMFLLVLSGFVLLMLVFTFFDLVGDILRNHIPLVTVGEYLINLTPACSTRSRRWRC